jgi:adenylylsulfate kinase
LPQSGKSYTASKLAEIIKPSYILDGDSLREGINKNLSFSLEDRMEAVRRAAEVAKVINNLGVNVFVALITPTNEMREYIKTIIPEVKLIYIDTPLEICEKRDTRGMYKLAREGVIKNFTGIDSIFENPSNGCIIIEYGDNLEIILNKIENG